jgi:hypothetical protein
VFPVVLRFVRGQVDDSLKAQAARIVGGDLNALGDGDMPAPSPKAGGPAQYSQIVASNGTIVADLGGLHLPIDPTARAVAGGRLSSAFEDIHVEGQPSTDARSGRFWRGR